MKDYLTQQVVLQDYWRHIILPNVIIRTLNSGDMEMVSIISGFIRADREGNWELHFELFAKILPWFALYSHNYARWGPVYLADMKQLESTAPDVHREVMEGRFRSKD